ncbi:helix-turn-helix transcriptional regulator [Peptostreptococcus porci]|uniref:helix-turn-helix transcriptional regulator n=1 Tax=Peptostreptococcus porci TaxID=2652282 RepID=UPI002A80ADB3|nr:helix-turn-helix transcriptional regulator [Peptostreptococcus porci]MDY4128672.1 helix-turn-helix transcriptional regulator [Peptostreptococcus porci]
MEILKKVREEKNITQKEISSKVGISQQAYSLIEKGINQPSLNVAFKIADFLDSDVRQLFYTQTDN